MNRTKPLLILFAMSLAVAGVIALAFRDYGKEWSHHRNHYSKVRMEMTRSEIDKLFGRPAGPANQGEDSVLHFMELVEEEGVDGKPAIWSDPFGQVLVYFDSWEPDARVVGKQLYRANGDTMSVEAEPY